MWGTFRVLRVFRSCEWLRSRREASGLEAAARGRRVSSTKMSGGELEAGCFLFLALQSLAPTGLLVGVSP